MEDPEPYLQLLVLLGIVFKGFTLTTIVSLLVVAILLFFSALISGSEVAFFSLSPTDLHHISQSKKKRDLLIKELKERPKRLLATILITNNFINIAIVIIFTFVISQLFDFADNKLLGFIVEVIIVTAFILLVGEITPKIYAAHYPYRLSKIMSFYIKKLMSVFRPLSTLLIYSTNLIDKRFEKKTGNITMTDLSHAIDITKGEELKEEDTKILKEIVKFADKNVKEIMVSRVDVTALNIESDFDNVLEIIIKSGFSRIPVYQDSFDNVLGLLYVKDLLPYLNKEKDFAWQDLLRSALFVPESKMINDLLQEFQEKKMHLAIIVDEYGGTSGICTLEDIVEEIVGEISDEYDSTKEDEAFYKKIAENTYVFGGKTTINDFCKVFDLENDFFDNIKGEFESLAGMLLELEGQMPEKDTIILHKNFSFKVTAVDKRRIHSVEINMKPENNPE